MPKRKVRHALVQYSVPTGDGGTMPETAFRNQIVDIPQDQVKRLDELGATVPEDQDLDRPGRMLTLPETAGDAEILSWVIGASSAEVEALVRERPAMAARILAAKESVTARFKEQDEHLSGGGLKKIANAAEAEAARAAEADLIGDGGVFTPEQADEIVKGKATDVTDYISENPANAAAILEAEGRRATAAKESVRVSVARSAEAAAGFTQ